MKRFALVFAALAAVLAVMGTPAALAASGPTVVTGAASGQTTTTATLSGTVNLNGSTIPTISLTSTCYFEYGTTTSYGSQATCSTTPAATGTTTVTANLTSLTAGATYHFQLVVYTGGVLDTGLGSTPTDGGDVSFTTPSASGGSGGSSTSAPVVTTAAASTVGSASATLNGSIDPQNWGLDSCSFSYGVSGSSMTTANCASTPTGSGAQAVSAAVSGLTPGTTYTYSLSTTYNAGASTATSSTSGSFTTIEATILAPTNLASTSATLTGTVNPEGQSVSSCTFYYAAGSAEQSAPCSTPASQITGTSPVNVNANVTGLTAKTAYEDTVVLMTSGGGEAFAVPVSFTTPATPAVPVATANTATNVTATTATLRATVNAEGEGVRGCEFEWGVNDLTATSTPGNDEALAEPCTTTPADSGNQAVTVALSGLAPGTKYYYRLLFLTYGGLVESTTESFTTLKTNAAGGTPAANTPKVKITKTALNKKSHSVKFTFARSGSVGITKGYQCALVTITKGKSSKLKWASCKSAKSYSKLGVKSYEFWVRAGNARGWGAAVGHKFTA